MACLDAMHTNRPLLPSWRPRGWKPPLLAWTLLAGALLLVSIACGQTRAPAGPPTATAVPALISRVLFTPATPYQQAIDLLTSLELAASHYDCILSLTPGGSEETPPPSTDTPGFFAEFHTLFVASWGTPQGYKQLAQLQASPLVFMVFVMFELPCGQAV